MKILHWWLKVELTLVLGSKDKKKMSRAINQHAALVANNAFFQHTISTSFPSKFSLSI
jgi:hypothetical protein